MPERMLTTVGGTALSDPALPFLNKVADAEGLMELFVAHVLPVLAPGREFAVVRLDDVTYTPGHKCVMLCSLIPPGGADAAIQRALVTMSSSDRLADVYSHTYSGEAPGSAQFLPEFGALVELFPADYALPTLAHASSPERMRPVLARLADGFEIESPPHIEVLHYRPHRRCVLGYQLGGGNAGGPEMVGKLYRTGVEAQDAWSQLDFAHSQLTRSGFAVPRPFPLVDHLNLLIMERVAGTLLKRKLQEHGPLSDKQRAVTLAARLVATLHGLPVDSAGARTIDIELRALRKRAEPLTMVAPEFARRVQELIARVAQRASRTTTGTRCFIHGDFTPSQLLLTQDGAAVLDFDLAGSGDPAIDVANFTTKLRRRARRTRDGELRTLATTFLDAYQQHAPADGSLAARVQVLESIALVRTAIRAFRHGPFSYGDGSTSSLPQLFLDEAEDSLSGG